MENIKKTVSAAETDTISRKLLVWLNKYPKMPDGVDLIRFEYLPADTISVALSTIQTGYILSKYIAGGYLAELQFKLIYRIKPGTSNDKRLKADEFLNELADWTSTEPPPEIGEGKRAILIAPATRSSVFAMYENGDEDHQILMKMNYEVI